MTLPPSPFARLGRSIARTFGRIGAAVLGLLLALAGFLLMIGAVLVGITAAVGLFAWAALRGRKAAPMAFHWRGRRFHGVPRRLGRAADDAEVVDVQVRELPRTPPD